jgi:superfamily II DNA/RNA helicase
MELSQGRQVIVGTLARIKFLLDQQFLDVSSIKMLILEEAHEVSPFHLNKLFENFKNFLSVVNE